jgi:hypothetical protein
MTRAVRDRVKLLIFNCISNMKKMRLTFNPPIFAKEYTLLHGLSYLLLNFSWRGVVMFCNKLI